MSALPIEQMAAQWLLRREEPGWTPDDQAALDAWLSESFANKAAYWRLEEGWRRADRLAALGGEGISTAPPSRFEAVRGTGWLVALAASLMLIVVAGLVIIVGRGGLGSAPVEVAQARFATPIGGRRTLALADGSRVELNTATSVRTAIGPQDREVWLDRGEAYFEVAHDEDRPFRVHAGPRTVTVLGTRFSVRRDADMVRVAVVEGRVRIEPTAETPSERSATIGAGDLAIARGRSTLVAVSNARRVEGDLAWRDGMLTFDRTTLAEAAAEFNRYNRRQVVIADPETAAIQIGGSFQASNLDAFARLLRDAYGLEVESAGDRVTISS